VGALDLPTVSKDFLRFPIIVGPTAGGKSALAVEVALQLARDGGVQGEVVTADSIQVYRGLDIGSAKPTQDEMRGVVHHLIDIVEPTERFSLHDWLVLVEQKIDEIKARGAMPIVVGGTHLYVKALVDGMFEGPEVDEELRAKLNATPLTELRVELERVDPAAAKKINAMDLRRTVRALEVYLSTGTPISTLQTQWDQERTRRTDCVIVGLDWPTEQINRRINSRVKMMYELGLVEETRSLWNAGKLGVQAREALGYKQLIEHFEGRLKAGEAFEKIKIETRRFGKNQRTWLKRLKMTAGSVWIDAERTQIEAWPAIVIDAMKAPAPALRA
jgi:tRNA dimethylallyltransferase